MRYDDRDCFRTVKCPYCGKEFFPTANHIYKDKNTNAEYCCWTCFNHRYDDLNDRRPIEMLNFDGKVMKTFNSVAEALLYAGGTPKGLLNAVGNEIGYRRFKWRYKQTI